jgi:hypothetical protein
MERFIMILETGDVIEVTFDDPALFGQSTKGILIGKKKECYWIFTSENSIAIIDDMNVKRNYGTTLESKEKAISILDNWKGSYKPSII